MASTHYWTQGPVAVIQLGDQKTNPHNFINKAIQDQLDSGLDRAANDPNVKAVLLCTQGKNFSRGGDLKEFGYLNPHFAPVQRMIDQIQRLENSSKPVVVAIQGIAIGGGFEYSLGCHYRIANASARLLFPEIVVGLIPGALGTQHLPRVAGVQVALQVIAEGKTLKAPEALRVGVLDKVVDGDLIEEGIKFAASIMNDPLDGRRTSLRKIPDKEHAEQLLQASMEKAIKRRPHKDRIAPELAIKAIRAAVEKTYEEGVRIENELFETVNNSAQSAGLQHLFLSQGDMSKWGNSTVKPEAVKSGAVIGGGTMGSGIIICMLRAGIPVVLVEKDQKALDKNVRRIQAILEEGIKLRKSTEATVRKAMSYLKPALDLDDLKNVDIVIEAIPENMEMKKQLFSQLDRVCGPHTLLCTNTSTLDIDQLAGVTSRADKVMGTHFFTPSFHNTFLENVRGRQTSDHTIATVMAFSERIGKVAVLVKNCHGFLGNRMMLNMVNEALFLLEEGAAPQKVDQVMEEFGFVMGPFKVMDMIGLDIALQIKQEQVKLNGLTYDPTSRFQGNIEMSLLFEELVSKGRLGRKSGLGWYNYGKADARKPYIEESLTEAIKKYSIKHEIKHRAISDQEILDRCLLGVVNEGFKVLTDGIAQRPADVDVLWCLGYGWPHHRGGPMLYATHIGLPLVQQKISHYHNLYPSRPYWKPSGLLQKLSGQNLPLHKWMKFIASKL